MRGRNNNNRNNNKGPNPLTKSYESNGPDVKIRGTAQHVAEKYSQLARDALSSGDPVSAENYFQHAEHYYRIIAAAQEQLREQYGYQQRPFDEDGNEEEGFGQGDRPGFERQAAAKISAMARRPITAPSRSLTRIAASARPASTARTVKIARTGTTVPSGRIARIGMTARIAASGASASSATAIRARTARARTASARTARAKTSSATTSLSRPGPRTASATSARPASSARIAMTARIGKIGMTAPSAPSVSSGGIARSAVSASRVTAVATKPRRPSRAPCRPS